MSEMNHNNRNPESEPDMRNSAEASAQNGSDGQYYNTSDQNSGQYYNEQQYNSYAPYGSSPQNYQNQPGSNGQQYYSGQPDYNGQYYGQNGNYNNGQYYGQNNGYNGQQYYDQNSSYNGQQNYDQNNSYNNGQYYGQNSDYNNGQYYGQDSGYNNGQYYGQNSGYNNGQYYGQNTSYNNGQYYGQNASYNNGQYYGQNSGYNGQPYANPQSAFGAAAPAETPVTNIFYYILMALTAISTIIGLIAAKGLITNLFSTIDFNSAATQDFSTMYSAMMESLISAPGYSAYSMLSSTLSFAILVISIIDIVVVYRNGYPIVGMILFTILFKPGYFIWRAHVVKQKKTIPVIYTIAYVILYMIYVFWSVSFMMSLIAYA